MNNIWTGNRIRLRAVEASDWETFHAWDQDTEVAQLSYEIPFPRNAANSQEWAERESKEPPKDDVYRFVIESLDGEMVGTLNTHSCDRRNGTFKYGLGIMRDHWRKGYASEAISLVLRYYFGELCYQKVMAHVYDFNDGSIKLHRAMGFVEEGRLRRTGFTNGTYHDELVFGMTNDEFFTRYTLPST